MSPWERGRPARILSLPMLPSPVEPEGVEATPLSGNARLTPIPFVTMTDSHLPSQARPGCRVVQDGARQEPMSISPSHLRICLLGSILILSWACGQPETSRGPADPAPGAPAGLADRLTAMGAEVQADAEGHITLLNLYWTDLTDDDLTLLGGLDRLRTLIMPVRATTEGLRHLKGLTALAELYPPNEITDEGLAGLRHLPNIKELFLYGSKITDAGLVHFKPLQQLEFLGIQHTGVTGSGLIHLQDLANLAWLDLSYTRIGDPELKQLAKLSQLKAVGLYGTRVSPSGIRRIQAALPNCTVLYR